MKDEVIQATAAKLGLPYELVETVVGSMFTSVKQMIRQPHLCKKGVVLAKHFMFKVDYFRLVNQIHSLLISKYRYTPRSEYRIRYWMNIVLYLETVMHPRCKEWRLKKAEKLGIVDYDDFIARFDDYYNQTSLLNSELTKKIEVMIEESSSIDSTKSTKKRKK